jgi:CHAT domain-containing protein
LRAPLIEKGEIKEHRELGAKLYQLLLQPAATQLQGKSKLIIVPDSSVNSLPFEALIAENGEGADNKDNEQLLFVPYLVKNYTITYSPSASVLVMLEKARALHSQRASSPGPLLAFGDPSPMPDGFNRLTHSAEEVQKIAGIVGMALSSDAVNLQEKATKKHLREMDLSRYRMLHFATHAVLSEPVQRITQPALVLSSAGADSPYDSFLQMGEIFNLRLNADLVVLSACDTGRGKSYRGEGVVGLTRSFMYAGTPSVVASLWRVSDESTSRFMEFFYRNLKEGRPKAEALRLAKIELMETLVWNDQSQDEFPKFQSPYFWAPFILMGSGN